MSHIELSTEERHELSQLLEEALPKLDVEIHRTDSLEFKEALVRRRHLLTQLLVKTGQVEQVMAERARRASTLRTLK